MTMTWTTLAAEMEGGTSTTSSEPAIPMTKTMKEEGMVDSSWGEDGLAALSGKKLGIDVQLSFLPGCHRGHQGRRAIEGRERVRFATFGH
jgi:hypothetical protein